MVKKWKLVIATSLAVVTLGVLAGLVLADPASLASTASVATGGKLYDKWWAAAPGATEPKGDHPLWSTQNSNTRTGLDTWRCKECHGWDYLGKDGAYGSGSHKTGFVGVSEAGKSKTTDQLIAILKGSTNPKHDFSSQLDSTSLANLAAFLKEGLIDTKAVVDYATKKPKNADMSRGQKLYGDTCASCHAANGTKLNFGTETAPEFVGTIAASNPQEFLHKARSGQAGAAMPSAIEMGWTLQNTVDLLAYAQTLPTNVEVAPVVAALPKTGESGPQLIILVLAGTGIAAAGLLARRTVSRRAP